MKIKNENPNEEITEIDTDGAYFDQNLVDQALDNKIKMYFTNLVGNKPNPDKLSPTEFKIDEEQNVIVECPNGIAPIRSDFSKGVYSAHFDDERCRTCPLYNLCLIKRQKKSNVVRFSEKTYKTEQVRKEMSTDEYKTKANKRAGVEGIPSALRRGYNVDHMPIRGLLRSKLHFGFKILALNVKKLQRGLEYMEKTTMNSCLNTINQEECILFRKTYKFLRFKLNLAA